MSKHKSEDYKITAVKYYLENDTNYTKTCEIFKYSERSLKRWIERYEELEEIKRLNRKPISYKITKEQVKYYLENNTNYTKTCEIFKCSERSLKRWIERYEELEEIKRLNKKPVSYKITKEQVKYAIQKLKENEQITMVELHKIVKNQYKDFDIVLYNECN